jgi:hypothetical protein
MNSVNFGTKKAQRYTDNNEEAPFRTKEASLCCRRKQSAIYAVGMLFITSVCLRIETM